MVVAGLLQESGAACLPQKECTLTGFLTRMNHLPGRSQCLCEAAIHRKPSYDCDNDNLRNPDT